MDAAQVVRDVGRKYDLSYRHTFDDISEAGGCIWSSTSDGLSLSVRAEHGSTEPSLVYHTKLGRSFFEKTVPIRNVSKSDLLKMIDAFERRRYAIKKYFFKKPAVLIFEADNKTLLAKIQF